MLKELFSVGGKKPAGSVAGKSVHDGGGESKGGGKIKLGDLVRDKISDTKGTAVERHYHLNGCEFLRVEHEGEPDKDDNIAVQRLELVESRPELHREDETMNGSHVKLGDEVRDVLTGFKGHAVIWAVPLYGSHRIIVEPPLKKDGALGDSFFFDECRLELITAKDPPKVPAAKRPVSKAKGAIGTAIKRETMRRETLAR